MRFHWLLALVAQVSLQSAACGQFPTPDWRFALSLSSTTDGQLFSLFLVKFGADSTIQETEPISRSNFIKQAQGRAFSKANPDGEDLFRKFGVKQCTLPEDSASMGFLADCSTFDNLWRLRYQSYPLRLSEGMQELLGWAAKPLKPDDRQMMLLSDYGMLYPLDLVIGKNLFRLLKDMGDPEWVNNYRGGL